MLQGLSEGFSNCMFSVSSSRNWEKFLHMQFTKSTCVAVTVFGACICNDSCKLTFYWMPWQTAVMKAKGSPTQSLVTGNLFTRSWVMPTSTVRETKLVNRSAPPWVCQFWNFVFEAPFVKPSIFLPYPLLLLLARKHVIDINCIWSKEGPK